MKIQLGFQPEDFTLRTWRGRDGSPDTPNFDDQVGRHLMGESGRARAGADRVRDQPLGSPLLSRPYLWRTGPAGLLPYESCAILPS